MPAFSPYRYGDDQLPDDPNDTGSVGALAYGAKTYDTPTTQTQHPVMLDTGAPSAQIEQTGRQTTQPAARPEPAAPAPIERRSEPAVPQRTFAQLQSEGIARPPMPEPAAPNPGIEAQRGATNYPVSDAPPMPPAGEMAAYQPYQPYAPANTGPTPPGARTAMPQAPQLPPGYTQGTGGDAGSIYGPDGKKIEGIDQQTGQAILAGGARGAPIADWFAQHENGMSREAQKAQGLTAAQNSSVESIRNLAKDPIWDTNTAVSGDGLYNNGVRVGDASADLRGNLSAIDQYAAAHPYTPPNNGTSMERYMINGEVVTPDGQLAPSEYQQQRTIGGVTTPYRNPDANPGAMQVSDESKAALEAALGQRLNLFGNTAGLPGGASGPGTSGVPATLDARPSVPTGPASGAGVATGGTGATIPQTGTGSTGTAGATGPTGASGGADGSGGSGATDILSLLLGGVSGNGAGSDVQKATQANTLKLLNSPSPYGQKEVQDEYNWLGGNIDDEYALKQNALDEEMARRGLGVSTNKAGRLNDLNIGKRSAKTALGQDLANKFATTSGQYQRDAINTGNAVGTQAQNSGLDWIKSLMGYGQQGFENDLATNQVNQNAANSYQDYILRLLGLGYGAAA